MMESLFLEWVTWVVCILLLITKLTQCLFYPSIWKVILTISPHTIGSDNYGKEYYPRRISPSLGLITGYPHLLAIMLGPQPLAMMRPPTDNSKEIQELQNKFNELLVKVANAREQRPKPTNQGTNFWCANCNGHDHLPIECPISIEGDKSKMKCNFCGGKHHISASWNLEEVKSIREEKQPNNVTFKRPFIHLPYKPNDSRPW